MYSCSFKRKWFYGCKFWLTTELQKRIQIPSIKCPSWTDSCLIWQPHLSLLPTNSCVLGILKTPDSSCFHSCYFLCLNTFPSLTLWNTYSYFKSKIKHHFLIMHFPTFSSPSDSRKHPGMVCYIIYDTALVLSEYMSVYPTLWGKLLIFFIILERKVVPALEQGLEKYMFI